jgi:hypothetical protein
MVYKCKNCGAKLEIDKTTEFIKCAYCGSVNKIEVNPVKGYISDMKSKSRIGCLAIISFVLILIGTGLTVYFLNRPKQTPDTSETETNISLKKDLPYTYYLDNGFLIDFNGDKYIDIATMAINTDEKGAHYLQILDGKTGRILKQTKTDKEKNPDLYVFDKKYIFVAKDDFTFTLYDLNNLSVNKTFALTDKINYFKLTGDTLHIRTYDEIDRAIDLKTQTITNEDYQFDRSERPVDHYYLSEIREGDYVYKTVKKEKSSKNLFSVIAEKEGQVL